MGPLQAVAVIGIQNGTAGTMTAEALGVNRARLD
jgi:hypothetical protein